jgi:hypothetical protein
VSARLRRLFALAAARRPCGPPPPRVGGAFLTGVSKARWASGGFEPPRPHAACLPLVCRGCLWRVAARAPQWHLRAHNDTRRAPSTRTEPAICAFKGSVVGPIEVGSNAHGRTRFRARAAAAAERLEYRCSGSLSSPRPSFTATGTNPRGRRRTGAVRVCQQGQALRGRRELRPGDHVAASARPVFGGSHQRTVSAAGP